LRNLPHSSDVEGRRALAASRGWLVGERLVRNLDLLAGPDVWRDGHLQLLAVRRLAHELLPRPQPWRNGDFEHRLAAHFSRRSSTGK